MEGVACIIVTMCLAWCTKCQNAFVLQKVLYLMFLNMFRCRFFIFVTYFKIVGLHYWQSTKASTYWNPAYLKQINCFVGWLKTCVAPADSPAINAALHQYQGIRPHHLRHLIVSRANPEQWRADIYLVFRLHSAFLYTTCQEESVYSIFDMPYNFDKLKCITVILARIVTTIHFSKISKKLFRPFSTIV